MRSFSSLLALVALLFTVCCAPISGQKEPDHPENQFPSPPTIPPAHEIAKHIGASSVAMVFVSEEGVRPYCTGVWVSKDQFLTAQHCAEAAMRTGHRFDDEDAPAPKVVGTKVHYTIEAEVDDPGKETTGTHLGTVLLSDAEHDLALVKADGRAIPRHEIAALASVYPRVGEHLYIVGQPKGLYWSYIEGNVAAIRMDMSGMGWDKKGPFLQASAPVYFGNSGGGAFNAYGELIGIASFITRAPNTAFFVHVSAIKEFMDQLDQ